MIKGRQGVTTYAKNPNAKYKITTIKKQSITGNDLQLQMKYTYSRLISAILPKYSYAI